MYLDDLSARAKKNQLEEDERALNDDESKIGEGANNSAHVSPRGYVVKPVSFDWRSENPFEMAERVEGIDRFPWLEVDERDQEGPFEYATVKIARNDLTHEEVAETCYVSDVISEDLDMFFDLRQEDITYRDLKPENIGYFWEEDSFTAKPIDVIDAHAWEEEEELMYRRFSDIMDVYIRGTPNESGLTNLYQVSVPEAEEHVFNYLGLETTHITGDPYYDLFQVLDESQETMGDVFDYE